MQTELAQGQSQRAIAEQVRVPQPTLQGWLAQGPSGNVPAALAQFYSSEEGVAWLNRQVLAAQLVITLLAGAGIHPRNARGHHQ